MLIIRLKIETDIGNNTLHDPWPLSEIQGIQRDPIFSDASSSSSSLSTRDTRAYSGSTITTNSDDSYGETAMSHSKSLLTYGTDESTIYPKYQNHMEAKDTEMTYFFQNVDH